jgi:spermidine synthase
VTKLHLALLVAPWLACFLADTVPARAAERQFTGAGAVELETKSDYSHIRVRKRGSVRTLIFVRDNGQEVGETMLDLRFPHRLLAEYTQFMFASYLFQPEPKRVLMVGLGGGAMVRFLQHHAPEVQIDAVEIDPVVVRLADEYFGTRSGEKVNVITADGFEFLENTQSRYDVVYFDAFLKPTNETDSTGLPLHLKTVDFYRHVRTKLSPNGVAVFNLNRHPSVREDIRTVQSAFGTVFVFRVRSTSNLIAVGLDADGATPPGVLLARGRQLDRRFRANFSFLDIARNLIRPPY